MNEPRNALLLYKSHDPTPLFLMRGSGRSPLSGLRTGELEGVRGEVWERFRVLASLNGPQEKSEQQSSLVAKEPDRFELPLGYSKDRPHSRNISK